MPAIALKKDCNYSEFWRSCERKERKEKE